MPNPKTLISEEDIKVRVEELAAQISLDYADKEEIVLVGVLKGSFIFLADLSRRLSIPRHIEFIAVSSYEHGSVRSGAVRLVMDVRRSIEGKHVLIVEDIVDTGHTLHYLIDMLKSRNPASIRTCTRETPHRSGPARCCIKNMQPRSTSKLITWASPSAMNGWLGTVSTMMRRTVRFPISA